MTPSSALLPDNWPQMFAEFAPGGALRSDEQGGTLGEWRASRVCEVEGVYTPRRASSPILWQCPTEIMARCEGRPDRTMLAARRANPHHPLSRRV